MTVSARCQHGVAAPFDLAVPVFELQALMSYTRRVIALEVKSPQPWTPQLESTYLSSNAQRFATLREAVSAEAGDVQLAYTIEAFTPLQVLTAALTPGSLLLLMLQPAAAVNATDLCGYCASLKASGFEVGIADDEGYAVWRKAIPYLSYVRLRYADRFSSEQKSMLEGPLRRRLTFISEGISDSLHLNSAIGTGFQMFQGTFAYRIPRLCWSLTDFKSRTLLLQKASSCEAVSLETITDLTACVPLEARSRALLKAFGVPERLLDQPGALLAELGDEQVKQWMQVCLVQEMAGQSSVTYVTRLFQLARMHEMMRETVLSRAVPSARFEGLLLGAIASVEPKGSVERTPELSRVLKEHSGTPMDCSAFHRNNAIVEAYRGAKWDAVETLGLMEGFSQGTLHRLYRESTVWARHFVGNVTGGS